jgi:hypothetical protein
MFMARWTTFMITGSALGLGLLAFNLLSCRRVMRAFRAAMQQSQQPAPVHVTQAQVEHALREVTQPAPATQGQPELPDAGAIKTGPPPS